MFTAILVGGKCVGVGWEVIKSNVLGQFVFITLASSTYLIRVNRCDGVSVYVSVICLLSYYDKMVLVTLSEHNGKI